MNTTLTEPFPTGPAEMEFAINPEPRCPCTLIVDDSASMARALAELNAGLREFKAKLLEDSLASVRVELALITFNSSPKIAVDFTPPERFDPPVLTAQGGTAVGAAVEMGLDMLAARMAAYRAAGLRTYKPWMILITDAESGDDIATAARRVKDAEAQNRLAFFGIGVEGCNMAKLAELSLRQPLRLHGLRFPDLFEWMTINFGSVVASRPGDQVPLTPPTWSVA